MNKALNNRWAAQIIHALVAAGCRQVIICPGNRDVPLILAALAQPGLSCLSHFDERSAAFRALGLSKALQQPTAVLTTSGSAVANCLPALCEAHAAGVPLIICSADRPLALQHSGAPQTMPQTDIFRQFCAASIDLGDPAAERLPAMGQALQRSLKAGLAAPGPVHINAPFDDPLYTALAHNTHESSELIAEQEWPNAGHDADAATAAAAIAAASEAITQAQRGVVVVGPDSPLSAEQLKPFAAAGWPIICDVAGRYRWSGLETMIGMGDSLLAGPLAGVQVDCLVRCGPAPLARPVWEWLQRQDCPVLRFDRQVVSKDFCHAQFYFLGSGNPATWTTVTSALRSLAATWSASWLTAEEAAGKAMMNWLRHQPWNEAVAASRVCRVPGPGHLALSNSLSVRHGNRFCHRHYPWAGVWMNRGVNGIDGTLGTAMGLSEGLGPVRLLCGDVALLHDSPALEAIGAQQSPLQIVILDNGGGRIFDTLPAAAAPTLAPFLRTPPRCDWRHLARAFHLDYRCPHNVPQLDQTLRNPSHKPTLIHIPLPSEGPGQALRELQQHLENALSTIGGLP